MDKDDQPLGAEAAKRSAWRGNEDAPGPGESDTSSADGAAEEDAGGVPPTTWAMRPPD